MKFKRIIPYLIAGIPFAASVNNAHAQFISAPQTNNDITAKIVNTNRANDLLALAEKVDVHFYDVYNVENYLDLKAEDLCAQYKTNMLDSQARLAPFVGKRGYANAVRQELPGAPVGVHCVYGQYTQLQRALDAMGDTLTIVPVCASRQCTEFKKQMRQRYSDANGYENCIFEGRMYETDSAYMAAMNAYLVRNHATTDAAAMRYMQKFEQRNFSVESIEPGSMLIVPRTPGNTRQFHMIMYVGRGRIENNKFIPDGNGRPVYTAHNREKLGYLFDTWDTNNIFAANIQQIARAKYAQELKRIESLPRQQLIEYILSGKVSVSADQLEKMPTSMLQKMARDKYFNSQIPRIRQNHIPAIAQNAFCSPLTVMLQHSKTHTI
ncbi:MAG: hypothetical protein K2M34_04520 [Alphaproteobacteria bacterium]|nr:hypothetical protein [Alphaproteobacteria bacterium]